jgi:hypothetical protein
MQEHIITQERQTQIKRGYLKKANTHNPNERRKGRKK